MSTFIESLKRLYKVKKIDKSKLDELKNNNKITDLEYQYITAE